MSSNSRLIIKFLEREFFFFDSASKQGREFNLNDNANDSINRCVYNEIFCVTGNCLTVRFV